MRKLTAIVHKSGVICLFINQLRHKIGITFGSPETTSGGNALKFYASIRLDIRKIGVLRVGNEMVGHRVRVKVVKNKLAAPFREVTFDLRYGMGICRASELIERGLALAVVQQAGSWYTYQGKQLGQGREAVRHHFIERPELQQALQDAITQEETKRRSSQMGTVGKGARAIALRSILTNGNFLCAFYPILKAAYSCCHANTAKQLHRSSCLRSILRFLLEYLEWASNPYELSSQDFKSCVSTNSIIQAKTLLCTKRKGKATSFSQCHICKVTSFSTSDLFT